MRKLNQQKIRWIINQIDKGTRSTYRIAKTQQITPRWARELHQRFHKIHQYPYPKKSGRKPKPITEEEKRIILETRQHHPLSAVTLEKILDEQGIHIGHNRIHKILKNQGLAKDEPHKQKRRKWVSLRKKMQ
jgi:transposase